jgi:OTU-like cysteine protease.
MAIKFWDANILFQQQNTKPKQRRLQPELNHHGHNHNHHECCHDHSSENHHDHHGHHHHEEGKVDQLEYDNKPEIDYWKNQAYKLQKDLEASREERKILLTYLHQFEQNEKLAFQKIQSLKEENSRLKARLELENYLVRINDLNNIKLDLGTSLNAAGIEHSTLYHSIALAFESKKYLKISDKKEKRLFLLSLRKLVSHFLLQNLDILKESTEDPITIIQKIENENVDGGSLELEALSTHYDVQIVVLEKNSRDQRSYPSGKIKKNRLFLLKHTASTGQSIFDLIYAKIDSSNQEDTHIKSIFQANDSSTIDIPQHILDFISK